MLLIATHDNVVDAEVAAEHAARFAEAVSAATATAEAAEEAAAATAAALTTILTLESAAAAVGDGDVGAVAAVPASAVTPGEVEGKAGEADEDGEFEAYLMTIDTDAMQRQLIATPRAGGNSAAGSVGRRTDASAPSTVAAPAPAASASLAASARSPQPNSSGVALAIAVEKALAALRAALGHSSISYLALPR